MSIFWNILTSGFYEQDDDGGDNNLVPVTQAQYDACFSNLSSLQNSGSPAEIVFDSVFGYPVAKAIEVSVSQQSEAKRAAINEMYETAMEAIKNKYPPSEINGWPRQTSEFERYRVAELSPPVVPSQFPVLSQLAGQTGYSLSEMVDRVEVKVNEFDGFYGAITGKRQALEAALDAIDTNSASANENIDAIDENEIIILAQSIAGA
ncbi:MAG: hypothetical protein K6L75_02530 [Cellvibrionaceae bacterium]